MTITMQRAAGLLGLPRVRHCRKCALCGGVLLETHVERTGRNAYLHDFERLAWICEDCGEEAAS